MYVLENFSRSILFDEEFESALLFLKNAKAIFSVCDVITRKVYCTPNHAITTTNIIYITFEDNSEYYTSEDDRDRIDDNVFSLYVLKEHHRHHRKSCENCFFPSL